MSIDLYVHIVLFVENIQNLIGHFEQLFVFENSIFIGNLLNYVSFIGALLVVFFAAFLYLCGCVSQKGNSGQACANQNCIHKPRFDKESAGC